MPPARVKKWNEGRHHWVRMDQYPTKIGTVKLNHQERPIRQPGLLAEDLLSPVTYWLKK